MENRKTNIQDDSMPTHPDGTEVLNAINAGFTTQYYPVEGNSYLIIGQVSEYPTVPVSGKVISRHIDTELEQIVVRIELSNGELGYYIYSWAESYAQDGG